MPARRRREPPRRKVREGWSGREEKRCVPGAIPEVIRCEVCRMGRAMEEMIGGRVERYAFQAHGVVDLPTNTS